MRIDDTSGAENEQQCEQGNGYTNPHGQRARRSFARPLALDHVKQRHGKAQQDAQQNCNNDDPGKHGECPWRYEQGLYPR